MGQDFVNRRQYFRIKVDLAPCRLQILSIRGTKVNIDKEMLGHIVDISAGGMLVQTALDLPVDKKIVVKAFFKLLGETFALEASIVRQEVHGDMFRYGLRFDNVIDRERVRLLRVLSRLQVKQRSRKHS